MNFMYRPVYPNEVLCHHGILGQKWGVRRYQNEDGSLTSEGKMRYKTSGSREEKRGLRKLKKQAKSYERKHNRAAKKEATKPSVKITNKKNRLEQVMDNIDKLWDDPVNLSSLGSEKSRRKVKALIETYDRTDSYKIRSSNDELLYKNKR